MGRSQKLLERGATVTINRMELLKMFPRKSIGMEVGTGDGNYTATMIKVVQPKCLYTVDSWRFWDASVYGKRYEPLETIQMRNKVRETYPQQQEEAKQVVMSKFAKEIAAKQLIVMHMTSVQALNQLADNTLDWIYLDGCHLYEVVLAELFCAQRVVKPGGFISGHDYCHDLRWEDGVIIAVDEFIEAGLVEMISLGNKNPGSSQETNYVLKNK